MRLLFVLECNNISTIWACGKSSSLGSSLDCFWHLRECGSTMCAKPKLRIFVVFNSLAITISLICLSHVTRLFGTQLQWNTRFWWRASNILTKHAKKMVHVLNLFISFMVSFQKVKTYIGHDVKHMLQRLGASHSIY
jgi:hypothetical protein